MIKSWQTSTQTGKCEPICDDASNNVKQKTSEYQDCWTWFWHYFTKYGWIQLNLIQLTRTASKQLYLDNYDEAKLNLNESWHQKFHMTATGRSNRGTDRLLQTHLVITANLKAGQWSAGYLSTTQVIDTTKLHWTRYKPIFRTTVKDYL